MHSQLLDPNPDHSRRGPALYIYAAMRGQCARACGASSRNSYHRRGSAHTISPRSQMQKTTGTAAPSGRVWQCTPGPCLRPYSHVPAGRGARGHGKVRGREEERV
eukprot:3157508-Rhodomonas_salina.3